MTTVKRSRAKLLLVVAMFALPMLVAIVLAQTGWRPAGKRNFGTLVQPPQDFRAVRAHEEADATIDWDSGDGTWWVVLSLPPDCAEPCARMLDALQRVRAGLNRHAGRVRVLVSGPIAPEMRTALQRFPEARAVAMDPDLLPHDAALPPAANERIATLPVYVIDPHGYLVLRYDAGTDLTGLRKDLARLLK